MVDNTGVRQAASDIRELGGADGLAGHIQTIAYGTPGSTTENVVYDLALAVGLWCSDVADLLDAVADEADAADATDAAGGSDGSAADGQGGGRS